MDNLSFRRFIEEQEKDKEVKSSLPNAARVNLGIKKSEFEQALKGMFPTVNSQMIMPTNKASKVQISVAPVDYKLSADGKRASMNIMADDTPYVFVNDRDIYKGGNIKLRLAPSSVDKMMFQGMPIQQGAPPAGGAPPMMPPS
jgi:hypothetical protein